jgi:hypothetical protein
MLADGLQPRRQESARGRMPRAATKMVAVPDDYALDTQGFNWAA